MKRLALAPITLLVAVACAPASQSATGSGYPNLGSRDRNLITAEEIQTVRTGTAMDVVRRLRPQWLRKSRARRGGESPVVYVDGWPRGEPSALADIQIASIQDIRYLSAPDATQLYGIGHNAGVILVTLLKR